MRMRQFSVNFIRTKVHPMITEKTYAWSGGKCRTAMFWGYGSPAGLCGEEAYGPQLPMDLLKEMHGPFHHPSFCIGPCCPSHGGPRKGDPIVFQDGLTDRGRQMWCAVMPDFKNLQESPAGFSPSGYQAIQNLKKAIDSARAAIGDRHEG